MFLSRVVDAVIVAAFLLILLVGCADVGDGSTRFHTEAGLLAVDYGALLKDKRYAIVSITYANDIKSDGDQKLGRLAESQALANQLEPVIVRAVESAASIKVIPTASVVSNPQYLKVPADPLDVDDVASPSKLKNFGDDGAFASLASALRVDGVIRMHVVFSAASNSAPCYASFHGGTLITVTVYDKTGHRMWSSAFSRRSKEGIKRAACLGLIGVDTAALFKEMRPLLLESTAAAASEIPLRFNVVAK